MSHSNDELRALVFNAFDDLEAGVDRGTVQVGLVAAIAALATAQPDTPREHPAAQGDAGTVREDDPNETPPCSTHPDAPHGFDRNSSHSLHRYVCDCEGWQPEGTHPQGEHKETDRG